MPKFDKFKNPAYQQRNIDSKRPGHVFDTDQTAPIIETPIKVTVQSDERIKLWRLQATKHCGSLSR